MLYKHLTFHTQNNVLPSFFYRPTSEKPVERGSQTSTNYTHFTRFRSFHNSFKCSRNLYNSLGFTQASLTSHFILATTILLASSISQLNSTWTTATNLHTHEHMSMFWEPRAQNRTWRLITWLISHSFHIHSTYFTLQHINCRPLGVKSIRHWKMKCFFDGEIVKNLWFVL